MKQTIEMFLKFGSLKNIKNLYENGTVYLNTIQYFRTDEDQQLRGDKYEGASRVKNSLPGSFHIPSMNHTVNFQKVHTKEAFPEVLGNIYSLYCIGSETIPNPLEFKLDKRIKKFGTHCLWVKDNPYFLESIKKKLTEDGYKFSYGLVNYYDKEKINSDLTVFHKPHEFEYQKEFRIYVKNDKIEPIKINIGSLKHFAEVCETKEIIKMHFTQNNQIPQP